MAAAGDPRGLSVATSAQGSFAADAAALSRCGRAWPCSLRWRGGEMTELPAGEERVRCRCESALQSGRGQCRVLVRYDYETELAAICDNCYAENREGHRSCHCPCVACHDYDAHWGADAGGSERVDTHPRSGAGSAEGLAAECGSTPSDSVGGIPRRPYRRDHILDSIAPQLQLYVLRRFSRSALRQLAAEEHLGVSFGRRSNHDIAADIVSARNAARSVAAVYGTSRGETAMGAWGPDFGEGIVAACNAMENAAEVPPPPPPPLVPPPARNKQPPHTGGLAKQATTRTAPAKAPAGEQRMTHCECPIAWRSSERRCQVLVPWENGPPWRRVCVDCWLAREHCVCRCASCAGEQAVLKPPAGESATAPGMAEDEAAAAEERHKKREERGMQRPPPGNNAKGGGNQK